MKDLIKSNREAMNFVINTMKRNLQELEFELSSKEDLIKDLEKGIEEKKEEVILLMKEIAVYRYCIGYMEHPETMKNLLKK